MKTKEEVREFINSELETSDYAPDYSELDSLAKLELIMKCEGEYIIAVDENEVGESHNWSTDRFVDYILEKINEKEK